MMGLGSEVGILGGDINPSFVRTVASVCGYPWPVNWQIGLSKIRDCSHGSIQVIPPFVDRVTIIFPESLLCKPDKSMNAR